MNTPNKNGNKPGSNGKSLLSVSVNKAGDRSKQYSYGTQLSA